MLQTYTNIIPRIRFCVPLRVVEREYKWSCSVRVVSAAMLMEDGTIITGVRHFSPDMRATMKRIYGEDYHLKVKEQGFINSQCNFMSREAAWILAQARGQIIRDVSYSGTLYSENLY
jgi:hypothetical protein